MAETYKRDVKQIADDIASYLERHKDAADTLEGITQWWLLRQRIEDTSVQVLEALEYLHEKGIVKSITTRGKTVYSAVRDKPKKNHAN